MLQIPIFHVNGEDPGRGPGRPAGDDFRREFKRDVVINMYGTGVWVTTKGMSRRLPSRFFTAIARRMSVREGYPEHLLKLAVSHGGSQCDCRDKA
jgi:2-oxoglutarate dehydrogenase complex dehydrogenase (E1) component-like enzyme